MSEVKPYTPEQTRVCDYLREITKDQIGCGDDPIGFLIASHRALRRRINLADALKALDAP